MAKRKYREGDVCDRCLWQKKKKKRSGGNLGCGEQTTACEGRALVTTGSEVSNGE